MSIWAIISIFTLIWAVHDICKFLTRDKTKKTVEIVDMTDWNPKPIYKGIKKLIIVVPILAAIGYILLNKLCANYAADIATTPSENRVLAKFTVLFLQSFLDKFPLAVFLCDAISLGIQLCIYSSQKRAADIWEALKINFGEEQRKQMAGTKISELDAEKYEAQGKKTSLLKELYLGIFNKTPKGGANANISNSPRNNTAASGHVPNNS